jgi:hypothetical protein
MMEDINEDAHHKYYWHSMTKDVKPVTYIGRLKFTTTKSMRMLKRREKLELLILIPKPNLQDAAYKEGDKML